MPRPETTPDGSAAGCWRRRSPDPESLLALRPRRILVVRQHNQMGDMVCATPCFRAIKETWPGGGGLVTAPVNREVVAHNPHLDAALPLRAEPVAAAGGPGRAGCATCAASTPSWPSCSTACRSRRPAPSWRSGRRRAGWSAATARPSGRRWPGLQPAPAGQPAASIATPWRTAWRRLQAVGIIRRTGSTVVVPSAAERRRPPIWSARLLAAGPFWALHPGAGKPQNCWPAARFAAVARRAARAGHPVLVLHGPADRRPLPRFQAALVARRPARNGADRDRRRRCRSGPWPPSWKGRAVPLQRHRVMHVAGALRVPTLALFGPTDPDLWKPPAVRGPRAAGGVRRRPCPTGRRGARVRLAGEPRRRGPRLAGLVDSPSARCRGIVWPRARHPVPGQVGIRDVRPA
jgi:hypothetical protein